MHPFPRVRRIAAENLYIRLLENPETDDEHPALSLLLEHQWDEGAAEKVQNAAREVAEALHVTTLLD